MAKRTVSPEQQIKRAGDHLWELENTLEAKGLPLYDLRSWLNQMLYVRDLQARHAAGELSADEYDDESED